VKISLVQRLVSTWSIYIVFGIVFPERFPVEREKNQSDDFLKTRLGGKTKKDTFLYDSLDPKTYRIPSLN
jgi:hypothetical protein